MLLHYPDVYQPCKPAVLQQTWVPNSLPMRVNYVDYEPQVTGVNNFCKYLQFYMWFYKGIKVNSLAIAQNISVVLIYKISPVQITTIIAENTENLLTSVPHTIEKLINQNCGKFLSYCKAKFGTFLKCHGYYCSIIINCSYTKHQRQQSTAHKIYCERKCTKVLQTHVFLSPCTFMFLSVTNAIGSISQNKH